MSIREYIKNNFKGLSKEEIKESIESSIKDNIEETLPGLGVMFEIVWNNINEEGKRKILETLEKNL